MSWGKGVLGSNDPQGSFMKGLSLGRTVKAKKLAKHKADRADTTRASDRDAKAKRESRTSAGSREQVA